MKLSEAMRRGSKMCKQSIRRWSGEDGSGCALATAAMGAGLIDNARNATIVMSTFIQRFPEVWNSAVCPACNRWSSLYEMIMHLNDEHQWTRERIAGWIEATHEVPVYSMLQIQEYMGEPVVKPAEVPSDR